MGVITLVILAVLTWLTLSGYKKRYFSKDMKKPIPNNGDLRPTHKNKATVLPVPKTNKEPLEQKLVSNIPGEDLIWKYPSLDLLEKVETGKAERGDIRSNAATIEKTLESFGIYAKVIEVNLGPTITQYALEVALGTNLNRITNLRNELAMALASKTGTLGIETPIPGHSLVGIELMNNVREYVPLRKVLESDEMQKSKSKLTVALGLDYIGRPIMADLNRMPYMIVAGTVKSGKSMFMTTCICTLLFRAAPTEVKLILIDPSRVNLTMFNGIPHLLSPVITDPSKVITALRWVMAEMDRRYKLFAESKVKNIDSYNEMSGFQALPYIVIFIDELAIVRQFSPDEIDDALTRIAQNGWPTGIHLVLSTQRPSVDIVPGLIKAEMPTRVSFALPSFVDSQVTLDMPGANELIGNGDMLFLDPNKAKPTRIQAPYVTDKDISSLVSFIKNQGIPNQYTEEVTTMSKVGTVTVGGISGDIDNLFKEAVKVVCQYDKASSSLLQRRLSIRYARAARIMDELTAAGVISKSDGTSKPREVLVQNAKQFLDSLDISKTSI